MSTSNFDDGKETLIVKITSQVLRIPKSLKSPKRGYIILKGEGDKNNIKNASLHLCTEYVDSKFHKNGEVVWP